MFIERATSKTFFLAPWERNVLDFPIDRRKHCAPLERGSWLKRFYKHLAPLEPGIACGVLAKGSKQCVCPS